MPFSLLEDSFGLQWWYQFRGARVAPQDVVIVALESQSSKVLGFANTPERWPRRIHADLVRGLSRQDATAIVFDLLFERTREPADDQLLADALRDSGRVLLATYMAREQQKLNTHSGLITLNTDQLIHPVPLLTDAAAGAAPFPLPKTRYGMREFLWFATSAGDEPTLALRAAALAQPDKYRRLLQQITPADNTAPATPLSATQLRQLHGVLPAGHILNLYGPPGTITTLTYDHALQRLADPDDTTFKHKVVLVGFSEFNQPENRDAYATAFSGADGLDMSGVELMATAIANTLHEDWLVRPGLFERLGILLCLAAALILPWYGQRTRTALLLNGLLMVMYVSAGAWLFQSHVWLPLVAPLALQWPVLTAAGLLYHQRRGHHHIVQLRDLLQRYVPGAAIQQVLQHSQNAGDTRVVCLCIDIAGYTTLAETMPPETLRQWLNDYFARVIGVINTHQGHVVDITGDALLALWPAAPDSASACHQALQAAHALRSREHDVDQNKVVARIGIHYGSVSFGEVGGANHVELRAVGDAINTTARLQGANKQLGTLMLISDDATQLLANASLANTSSSNTLALKQLGQLQLSGKSMPIIVHTWQDWPVPPWQQTRVLAAK